MLDPQLRPHAAAVAFADFVWAIAGAGTDVNAKEFILLTVGTPIYVFLKRRQSPSLVRAANPAGAMPAVSSLSKPTMAA